jgi:hypothetical protein
MAIYRGTGGASDSTDDSTISAVTTQAGIATTKASEAASSATAANTSATNAAASATAASGHASTSSDNATASSGSATNAAGFATAASNSATAASNSATAAANSASTANSAEVQAVAAKTTEITGVYNDIANVNTVAGNITNVNTVATNSSNITAVAADASDIGTVAGSISNVNTVGDNIASVNTVASNNTNINTVAADASDIGTVAGISGNVTTVAGISSDVTTVAGLESKMDTVIADASDIGTVAGNIGDVSTVAGISSDVDTVAGISSDVTSVADNMTAVQNATTSATNAATSAASASDSASAAATSAGTASSSASDASTSETNAANSATSASNSATAASGSASAASGSESASSGSASAAASSASAASTSASNASSSETNAASSATAAALSETSAANSATTATTIANDLGDLDSAITTAAGSATSAATSASTALGYRNEAETFKDSAYTYSQSAASAVAYQDLAAIAQSKSVTARDVFVYDTSKDSDGGAWRNRTQGTSWYNETLNTSTRGATKKFPAVAVIVAESNKVTIYDGDDPSMPMWATQASGTVVANAKAVTARNGLVSVATTSGYLATFNFVKGGPWELYDASGFDTWAGVLWGSIGSQISTDASKALVNGNVHDVAMTVLPNAPIDSETGLPVPTIAVATDGGVSVIKDDGSVVDIIPWNSNAESNDVGFTADNKIMLRNSWAAGIDSRIYIYDIPTTDVGDADYAELYSGIDFFNGVHASFDSRGATEVIAYQEESLAVAVAYSLKHLLLAERHSDLKANITSDYNTGWMNGDIKLATLSDTDDTNVTGSELVTNGDFSNGTTGWTSNGGDSAGGVPTISVNGSGQLQISSQYDDYGGANTEVNLTTGKRYTLSLDVISCNSIAQTRVGTLESVGSGSTTNIAYPLVLGSNSVTFTAVANANYLYIGGRNDVNSLVIDNVSLRLAEEDRSVNGNGLQVVGTVTKTAVATGADLVAYSGFSSSNRLVQPYNSDLDFGTGDFSIMAWVKTKSAASQYIIDRSNKTDNTNRLNFLIGGTNSNLFCRIGVTTVTASFSFAVGSWYCVALCRQNGVLRFYVNGNLIGSGANTQSNTGNFETTIAGYNAAGGQAAAGTSLLRISATAPTAEQIAKIYRDEKPLFQEGAQATLYGTSDAVTALAYDDDTELLHTGTSSGRSVFKGLQRVSNTTDAVGVAISASNDLVVEE